MRFSIVVPSYPPDEIGGMELQAKGLVGRMKGRHRITLVTRRYRSTKERGVRLVTVPYPRVGPAPLRYLLYLKLMVLVMLRRLPWEDPVLCYMLAPGGFAACLVRQLRRDEKQRIVVWVRGGDWYRLKDHALGRLLIGYTLSHADTVLAQTKRTAREIAAYAKGKGMRPSVAVLGNGVDGQETMAEGDALLFVGHLNRNKGIDVLIEAMKGLPEERLYVIGDGPLEKEMRAIAPDNVIFCGKMPKGQVAGYYRKAKALILPSVIGEGLPNAVLEAYSFGVPVIATDLGGTGDIVEEGRTGFLIRGGDSRAIADAVRRLDAKTLWRMRRAAKEEAEGYSWESVERGILAFMSAPAGASRGSR